MEINHPKFNLWQFSENIHKCVIFDHRKANKVNNFLAEYDAKIKEHEEPIFTLKNDQIKDVLLLLVRNPDVYFKQ